MLAYLEELCTALLAHDTMAVHRLLAHPLARGLPRQVREEALAISRASSASLRAPIHTLRFYHQTLQLHLSEREPGALDPDPNDGGTRDTATDPEGSSDTESAPTADPEGPTSAHATPVTEGRPQIEFPLVA